MKFIYVDESGGPDLGDIFVMAGLMIDAYRLRRQTQGLDDALDAILPVRPSGRMELKTSRFLNGRGNWGRIDADVRKGFVRKLCDLSIEGGGQIFALALSIGGFRSACKRFPDQPTGSNTWLASAMFLASLIQKKMQRVAKGKGLTVMIMDDNKQYMPRLSDTIHSRAPWFDGLYKVHKTHRNKKIWEPRSGDNRFDHVVNTPFAIKSNHSSLVQVADALCYIYRRHLELSTQSEAWRGERDYINGLIDTVEPRRQKLGRCPNEPCVQFFEEAKCSGWKL